MLPGFGLRHALLFSTLAGGLALHAATPPPAPCTSTVSPGRNPEAVKSIRYAVSQAVGRQAASAKLNSDGLSTKLVGGTHTCVAKVPG